MLHTIQYVVDAEKRRVMSKFKALYGKLVDTWVGQRIKDQENYPEHAHTFDQHFGIGTFASHLMGPLGGYEIETLKDAMVGVTYVVTDMCEVQTLVERGVIPGVEITVTNRTKDMVMFSIPGSGCMAIRVDQADVVKISKVLPIVT